MEHGWRTAGSDTAAGLVNNDVNRLPRRGESGFTLVEVLVAVVVLSITGLAAAQFAIGAIRTSYAQQQRSTAIALGSDGIERMRAQIAGSKAKPSHYYQDLLHGMGADGVKQAQANLAAVGAITSQVSDLASTATPRCGHLEIHSAGAYHHGQGRQTDHLHGEHRGGEMLQTQRHHGLFDRFGPGHHRHQRHLRCGRQDGRVTESQHSGRRIHSRERFLYQTRTYMPMVRVVVGVTWPDGMQRGKTCVYTTTELLNVIGD